MMRVIQTAEAPSAVGAYSQATTNEEILFTSGQIPMTADGELLAEASIAEQTEQVFDNIVAILDSEGGTLEDVLKMTVYLNDIDDFDEMNEVYSGFFDDSPPARSAVEVANLPKGVDIEIEAIASL
ncbi:reactive intermediate/imine deaminase [Halogranum amylolyticum]|uniref:Reactive intermediate/imine deaminase n=1 Tax=Halogranum amylolyticum TaxID=660520 RepID=A0A1H8UC86_9EURY|nr:Rid family detoxifying hydrolase [Halogranum amylolyticum]SEP00840.1 reactive intermediate/imine deaminase [Halogranum amylolyticum]